MRIGIAIVIMLSFLLISCNKKLTEVSSAPKESVIEKLPTYESLIADHRAEREAQLSKPTGWLSLIGLHWLDEGMNTLGAAEDSNIRLPRIEEETLGAYQKSGDEIFFGKVEGVDVWDNNEQPYLGGPVSTEYPYEVVHHKSLYWHILKRGDKYGLRLKDTLAEKRMNFAGLSYFEADKKFRFEAIVEPTEDSVVITNVLGISAKMPIAAYLSFGIAEHYYSIAALDEGGDSYYVVFGDKSNSIETYGGGRFLYPKKPCDTCRQVTILDFNKAENPPCAFTDFATCPLPPHQNQLKVKMLAGEKYAGDH